MSRKHLLDEKAPKPRKTGDEDRVSRHVSTHKASHGLDSLQQSVGNLAVQRLLAQRSGGGPTGLGEEMEARINHERGGGQPLGGTVQAQVADQQVAAKGKDEQERVKVETLHPSGARMARITRRETQRLAESIERLQPLLEKNKALFGTAGFDGLDVEGIDPREVDELRQDYGWLLRFANTHPGLHLHELFDGKKRSADDKMARVRERVEQLERLWQQSPEAEFLALDYETDSDDE